MQRVIMKNMRNMRNNMFTIINLKGEEKFRDSYLLKQKKGID